MNGGSERKAEKKERQAGRPPHEKKVEKTEEKNEKARKSGMATEQFSICGKHSRRLKTHTPFKLKRYPRRREVRGDRG